MKMTAARVVQFLEALESRYPHPMKILEQRADMTSKEMEIEGRKPQPMKIREKRGDMSNARKVMERERARQRYRADGGAQARRCYLRALKNIKRPRRETLEKGGVEEADYEIVGASKGGCHQEQG